MPTISQEPDPYLSFAKARCEARGKRGEHNTLYAIHVTVKDRDGNLDPNKKVGFWVEAPSVKVAFSMVEAMSQQMRGMDTAQFAKFRGKYTMRPFRPYLGQGKAGVDRITFYKANRMRTDIELAFGRKPGKGKRDNVLSREAMRSIDTLARYWEERRLERLHDRAHPPGALRVSMQARGPHI